MMRSMFSAVSGLRNHQTMMDVLASNIANVNTFGYKSERTTFKDALYQTLQGASGPVAGGVGGTNARQIGLGMNLNSVDQIMTQGTTQSTGVVTDLMINGDGFFRVAGTGATWGGVGGNDMTSVGGELYTRAGNFSFDSAGHLVTTGGNYVLGTLASTGNVGRLQVNPATTAAINVDAAGVITSVDAAGVATVIGTVSLAKFANPSGLERTGGNLYRESNNSGAAVNGNPAGAAGHGSVTPGALEMSNVDLALEFTNMIIAQRGFQANSRAISTSDDMLQELVNLKR
ncbi:MAG: flagellar hook-basal body complex protein [Actinobacteria bacterium]|nr:flagellar hook-basal body complex protein [Thermoleophilia bacterium]MCB9010646.1 flagellar hook-basal body complex protein [Actinomycetota bacterium]